MAKLRVYFSKVANPMVIHLSGMCVCHRGTPVPTEDTTSFATVALEAAGCETP